MIFLVLFIILGVLAAYLLFRILHLRGLLAGRRAVSELLTEEGMIMDQRQMIAADVAVSDLKMIGAAGGFLITRRGFTVERSEQRPVIVIHPVIVYKYLKIKKRRRSASH